MNCKEAKEIVNTLRHERMDVIAIDIADNVAYLEVYSAVMTSISNDYPFLSNEVERQRAKKIRRINKRELIA